MSAASSPAQPSSPQKRRKRHFFRWIFLALFVVAIVWVASSANPVAQGLREIGGDKPDQGILERTFAVSPRNFRYYKFTLPEGSATLRSWASSQPCSKGIKGLAQTDRRAPVAASNFLSSLKPPSRLGKREAVQLPFTTAVECHTPKCTPNCLTAGAFTISSSIINSAINSLLRAPARSAQASNCIPEVGSPTGFGASRHARQFRLKC
jgi:hypothetical protein